MSRNYMLTKRAAPKAARAVSQERKFEILRRPRITEKATNASQFGAYVFDVAVDASKPEIKAAVEEVFGVKVKAVNTLNQDGKKKRFRGKPGRRNDYKKAYVTLMPGQTLDAMQA